MGKTDERQCDCPIGKRMQELSDVCNPVKVAEFIKKSVIGQDRAVEAVSVAYANHVLGIITGAHWIRDHILLMGPTGCGKTEIFRQLREYILKNPVCSQKIPLVMADATAIKADGWRGMSKGTLMQKLIDESSAMALDRKTAGKVAAHGIIVLDEMDKLVSPEFSHGVNYSVYDQRALLGMLDGVPIGLGNDGAAGTMRTDGLLFFMTGAFDMLYEARRNRRKKPIGFADFQLGRENGIKTELIEFGMLPELAGRISGVESVDALTEEEIYRAVVESRNSCIRYYGTLLEPQGFTLRYSPEYIRLLINENRDAGLGVRGISSLLSEEIKRKEFVCYVNGTRRIDIGFADEAEPAFIEYAGM